MNLDELIDEIIKELEEAKDYPASDPPSEEVLDAAIKIIRNYQKIKAEIENDWQLQKYPNSPFSCGLKRAIEIMDIYMN